MEEGILGAKSRKQKHCQRTDSGMSAVAVMVGGDGDAFGSDLPPDRMALPAQGRSIQASKTLLAFAGQEQSPLVKGKHDERHEDKWCHIPEECVTE